MENTTQWIRPDLLRLTDNRFGDPATSEGQGRYGTDISSKSPEIKKLLARFAGMKLHQWAELGVAVFPDVPLAHKVRDDESHELTLFTLGHDNPANPTRTWLNTGNCMGVVRLRDKESGESVQIEIGSRFDEGQKQFFLTYLLSRVFGGSVVDLVGLGHDSLWEMLLAFAFRQRLLEASAVGLFKQYRTFGHNDIRVRGRIDVNEHLRRNIPFCGSVAYSTHEITFDNPTNHLIRYALVKIAQKWGALLTGDNRLADARHQLEQNTPTWQSGGVMPCIRRKENRTPIKHPYFHAVYEPLRQVSLAILRDEGASLYQQDQEAEGVIFDGSWLWEEYVWTLLKRLPGFEHSENRKQSNGWKPYPGVTFYPDFFHKAKRVVLDAKYQRHFDHQPQDHKQDIARQIFTYMFLLDAVHGGLINPDKDAKTSSQQITRQVTDARKTYWHNFVLVPSDASLSAAAFVAFMHGTEKDFLDDVAQLVLG